MKHIEEIKAKIAEIQKLLESGGKPTEGCSVFILLTEKDKEDENTSTTMAAICGEGAALFNSFCSIFKQDRDLMPIIHDAIHEVKSDSKEPMKGESFSDFLRRRMKQDGRRMDPLSSAILQMIDEKEGGK